MSVPSQSRPTDRPKQQAGSGCGCAGFCSERDGDKMKLGPIRSDPIRSTSLHFTVNVFLCRDRFTPFTIIILSPSTGPTDRHKHKWQS